MRRTRSSKWDRVLFCSAVGLAMAVLGGVLVKPSVPDEIRMILSMLLYFPALMFSMHGHGNISVVRFVIVAYLFWFAIAWFFTRKRN